MAAMVASWNTCPFCVGAHRAIAIRGMDVAVADAALSNYRTAPISDRLRVTLTFLERMTTDPDHLSREDAREALSQGITADELQDAAAIGAIFNIITRNANALDFAIPSSGDFDLAAAMLLRRGYA
jgi:AhpD family alkylhydroperoxidase